MCVEGDDDEGEREREEEEEERKKNGRIFLFETYFERLALHINQLLGSSSSSIFRYIS